MPGLAAGYAATRIGDPESEKHEYANMLRSPRIHFKLQVVDLSMQIPHDLYKAISIYVTEVLVAGETWCVYLVHSFLSHNISQKKILIDML